MHGHTRYPSRGACIYCAATGVALSDEHVVPYSLGGHHVLVGASCQSCASKTSGIERKVCRELWGIPRTAFNAPTRRRRERAAQLVMGGEPPLALPAAEYPAGFVFYTMGMPGRLRGYPEEIDVSGFWKMVVVDDDQRREQFLKNYPDRQLHLRFVHHSDAFARMLIKIAYCQVLTSVEPTDFDDLCLAYLFGQKSNLSHLVGALPEEPPSPGHGYSLSTISIGTADHVLLAARVRLLANAHTPTYLVIVGEVSGRDRIEHIQRKLEGAS